MKTSAISNPVNIVSGTASATKQSGASADTSFSRVLSREMASQPNAADPAGNRSVDSKQGARPAQSDAKSGDAKSAEQSDANAGQERQATSVASEKSSVAENAKTKGSADDKAQDDETTVSAASAELLALVANLAQVAVGPAKAAEAADSTDDKQAGLDKQARLDKQGPGAQSDGQLQDPLLVAQAAAQLLNSPAAEQNVALPRNQADAAQAIATKPAEAASAATLAPSRMVDAGQDLAAHAGKVKPQDSRAKPDQAVKGDTVASNEFDSKLAQAADDKAAPENNPAKTLTAKAELPAMQFATEKLAAKPAQELQQSGTAPLNVSAMTPQLQPAQTPAQAIPAHMSNVLTPRVGNPGWDQALGQKVVWMVGGEQQSASLTLNPPDLGPLQVVLHVSENQATANFTAAQPEVRHAIEAAMPKLREMLGEAGIQLGQANVSAGTPNHQQNAFAPPQQSSRQGGAAQTESTDTPVRASRSQVISSGQGMVDTFA